MGTFQAIAATGQAMLGLLSDACPRDMFPNAQFELYQMSNFQQPMEEGISLFLYRIAANTTRRNLPPSVDCRCAEHGTRLGRSSPEGPYAEAEGQSGKWTKAHPARRILGPI